MGIKLAAASGGSVELVPTNTASTFTVTVPAVTGNVVLTNVNGNVDINAAGANYLTLSTNSSERARIDSSGNLQIGSPTFAAGTLATRISPGNVSLRYNLSSNIEWFNFINSNGQVGTVSSSGSSTSYNTSSDYRLKEAIAPMQSALARVAALKPVTYRWKVDGSDGEGFIAHELQEVVPDCVTGEKDAVDAEGNPKYQGIDTSFLVATLTAAIQELKTIVDTQAAKIAALEAK